MSIQANDFLSNSLSGTVLVTESKIPIELPTVKIPFNGDKQFVVKIRRNSIAGPVIATSPQITLKDYTELLSITPNTFVVSEGSTVGFTVLTANIDNNSNLYFSTAGNVNQADFVSGNTGSFVILDNSANILLTANADLTDTIETGETFALQIRKDSIAGEIVITSDYVEIIDSSNVIGITNVISSSNIMYETESVVFTITTVNGNGNAAGTLYYTITGNADIYGNSFGSIIINDNTANLELIAESSVPDGEIREFAVQFRRNSIAGPILETTGSIIVNSVTANTLISVSAIGGDEVIEIDI